MVTTVDDALEWAKSGDMNCGPQTEAAVKIMAAELSRLRGAAVPFALSDAEGVALGRTIEPSRSHGASWAEKHLGDALRRAIDDLEFAQQQHAATCLRASEANMRACQLEREVASWKSSAIGMEISLEGRNDSLAEADKALATAVGLLRKHRQHTLCCDGFHHELEDLHEDDDSCPLEQEIDAFLAAHKEVQG